MGEIDEDAVAELGGTDPDAALTLLAEMVTATDRRLARLAARLAGRLVLEVARTGKAAGRGIGRLRSLPADRGEGDLDLDASVDALVTSRAGGVAPGLDELRVRGWRRPDTAVCLVVDRSGSMGGERLAAAAVAAAACALRAPREWACLVFADRILAVSSLDRPRPAAAVVDDLLRLRGRGTTDLAGALSAAADQLARASARRRITVVLSDCRANAGVDPVPVARTLDELIVLAPADDAVEAGEFAAATGARLAALTGPTDVARALAVTLGGLRA